MKILLCIIAGETFVITACILVCVVLGKLLARQTEKLKVARLQIASMEAVCNELARIKEQTAEKLERLSETQACIDYLAGGENGQN